MANKGAIAKLEYRHIEEFIIAMLSVVFVIPPRLVTRPARAAPKQVAISCTVVIDEDVKFSSDLGAKENTRVNK